MKNIYSLSLLQALLLVVSLSAQKPRYKLMWKDDFKSSSFDARSWSKISRGTAPWNRHMSSADSLYAVRDGCLVLRGIANRLLHNDTAQYLTGGLCTRGKHTVEYGKVEVRAKLGCAKGAWPAIWMLPDGAVKWPKGGEIDIMEHLNHDSKVYQTVHSYYTHVLGLHRTPPHGTSKPIDRDGFNTYAVEILPDSLVFSINGAPTFTYPRIKTDKEGQYPFGTPFYLLIDMQIGGDWVGKVSPEELPVEMYVDWVKMYRLKTPKKGHR